jgi:hypothetical protein
MSVIGALVSLLRGKQFYYEEAPAPVTARPGSGKQPASLRPGPKSGH